VRAAALAAVVTGVTKVEMPWMRQIAPRRSWSRRASAHLVSSAARQHSDPWGENIACPQHFRQGGEWSLIDRYPGRLINTGENTNIFVTYICNTIPWAWLNQAHFRQPYEFLL